MKKIVVALVVCMACMLTAAAMGPKPKKYDVTITSSGAVRLSTIVENFQGSPSAIRNAAKRYFENAYRESKFTIVGEDVENDAITARGQFYHFHQGKIGLKQYFLTVNFTVTVETKDNRMRVSIVADKYNGERIDMNFTKEVDDKISEFAPLNTSNGSKKGMYTKAFAVLYDKMCAVRQELIDAVVASVGTSVGGDDDW